MADFNTVLPPNILNITSQSNPIEGMTHQSGCYGWGEYLGICNCKPEERLNLIFSIMNAYHNDSKVITFCRNELQKIANCPSNYKNVYLQLELKKYGIGPAILCTYTDPKYTAFRIETETHTDECSSKTANNCTCDPEERTFRLNYLINKYKDEKEISSHLKRIQQYLDIQQKSIDSRFVNMVAQNTHIHNMPTIDSARRIIKDAGFSIYKK